MARENFNTLKISEPFSFWKNNANFAKNNQPEKEKIDKKYFTPKKNFFKSEKKFLNSLL